MQHGGDDARCAIGGGRHDAATGCVFFIYRQCIEVDPVQHLQRVAQRGLGVLAQGAEQRRRAAFDLEAAGQHAFGSTTPLNAVLHDLPNTQQARVDLGIGAPMLLVLAHDLRDAQAMLLCQYQQRVATRKGQGQHGGVGRDHLLAAAVGSHLVADDEAATDRVVHPVGELVASSIQRHKAHAVGMKG